MHSNLQLTHLSPWLGQDSSTVVRRIEDWLDRQLHRLWRDAEFNAAAKLPRPGSLGQQQEVRARLAKLRGLKTTIADLGAAAESERVQSTAAHRRLDSNNCEEHGVLSIEKVLASHGWLSPVELERIYGASGVQTAGYSVHRQRDLNKDDSARAARGLAWENRLWRLWRELSTMETLLLALSEPSGPAAQGVSPPADVGTLASLRDALPQKTRQVVLHLLGMDANEHVRRWPELHRGRGYKNQAALVGTIPR
jgi:hypothetical protein